MSSSGSGSAFATGRAQGYFPRRPSGYVASTAEVRAERAVAILTPTALATGGGNALPTCRYAAVLLPQNGQSGGNPWRIAAMRTVSTGLSPFHVGGGGSSATSFPFTPRLFHFARACV